MNKIRVLIIDDEPLARERIRELLRNDADITVVGESDNGTEALRSILERKPDLVFLDIQMPGLNGFEVLAKLAQHEIPEVIFVTAYDSFALKAFEVNALDYLLKPYDKERFFTALKKSKERLLTRTSEKLNENILSLVQHLSSNEKPDYVQRFVIKNAGRISFVEAQEVDWFEAEGNYIKLHVGAREELIRETIKNLEQKLDPAEFIRVQRSAIVRIKSIKEIVNWFSGSYKIILKSGAEVVSGKSYRDNLNRLIR